MHLPPQSFLRLCDSFVRVTGSNGSLQMRSLLKAILPGRFLGEAVRDGLRTSHPTSSVHPKKIHPQRTHPQWPRRAQQEQQEQRVGRAQQEQRVGRSQQERQGQQPERVGVGEAGAGRLT